MIAEVMNTEAPLFYDQTLDYIHAEFGHISGSQPVLSPLIDRSGESFAREKT